MEVSPGSPRGSLRYAPPRLGIGMVPRPRLVDALRGRFERRLTVLHAGAGFGKTTVLAQAVTENRLERRGVDAWLRVSDVDQDPTHLCAGVVRALSGSGGADAVSLDDVLDRVLAHAPEEVAIILDDVHLLAGSESAWQVVRTLLDDMPTNGHLVLSGRMAAPVPVSLLLARDDAFVLDEELLAFTMSELESFTDTRSLPRSLASELPQWPALAALTTSIGRHASSTFLWDEVFAALDPQRTRLLALAAPFDVVDDALVEALGGGVAYSAASLVEGLPLVQFDGLSAYRLHPLLAEAVRDRVDPATRAATLVRAGRALLASGAVRRAIEAASIAGDDDTLRRAVCRFVSRPIGRVSLPDVVGVYERLPDRLRVAPVGLLLDAARHWGASSTEAIRRFAGTVDAARSAGETDVEAIAAWRLLQLRYLDDRSLLVESPEIDRLAESGVPLGRSVRAFIRSVRAQEDGRLDDAATALEDLDDTDPDQRRAAMDVRTLDLGHPEAVPADFASLLGPGPPDLFSAISIWLRGEAAPEDAWTIASTFPDAAGRRGVHHDQASMLAIVAVVANAANETDAALRLVERAESMRDVVGRHVQCLISVARGLVALTVDGEEAALGHLRRSTDLVPLSASPTRGHLCALAVLRALLGDQAEMLDHAVLGPSLTTTISAGRALHDLRTTGDASRACALPWTSPNVIRCLVPPPLLTELALAASERDVPGATEVFDRIPERRRWLRRVADAGGPLARTARTRLDQLPARPGYSVRVLTLGTVDLVRSDGVAVDATRIARERVRQMIGLLVTRRRIARTELAAEMWPDLDPTKAADNLRVNLRHLQAALQPDRVGEPPWFVQVAGDVVSLAPDGLSVDMDDFDMHIRRAREAEASGLPTLALVDYRAAMTLYTGEFLPGVDTVDVGFERSRLSSMAVAARCRIGELVLAQGEPEAAMHEAVAALRLEPLSERAHRLFMRCHLAVGSSEEARAVGRRLLADLSGSAVTPEAETTALLRRLDVVQ